jgi:hypothetical protein
VREGVELQEQISFEEIVVLHTLLSYHEEAKIRLQSTKNTIDTRITGNSLSFFLVDKIDLLTTYLVLCKKVVVVKICTYCLPSVLPRAGV